MKVGSLQMRNMAIARALGAGVRLPIGPYIEITVKRPLGYCRLYWEVDPAVLRSAA